MSSVPNWFCFATGRHSLAGGTRSLVLSGIMLRLVVFRGVEDVAFSFFSVLDACFEKSLLLAPRVDRSVYINYTMPADKSNFRAKGRNDRH